MKKGLSIFFALATLIRVSLAQQWVNVPVSHGRETNSIAILNPSHILIAGGNESNDSIEDVFRSDNYGVYWTICPIGNIPTGLSSWIKSIAFADTLTGYGVGYNGKMIYSSDGGASWNFGSSPIDRNWNKVVYAGPSTLFVAGGWQIGDMTHTDSSQTILKSADGGNSWNVVYDSAGPWLTSLYFKNTQNGIAVGAGGTILYTNNGGSTWARIAAPVMRDFNGITFINTDTGYIVGGVQSNDSMRTILQTVNGGLSWTVLKDEQSAWLTDVSFLNGTFGNIVGEKATLLRTIDGGQTWAAETVNGAAGFERFTCVQFYDSLLGLIGTLNGEVFLYSNAVPPVAITLGSIPSSSSADLTAGANTNGTPGQVLFYFSTDSLFTTYGISPPQTVNTSSTGIVTQNIGSLISDTTYYYFVSVQNAAGLAYGNTLSFYTGPPFPVVQTLLPGNRTGTSVQLNGLWSGIPDSAIVSFDYGTTQQMDSSNSSGLFLPDTSLRQFSTVVNGLNTSQPYFCRFKVDTRNGIYYGNVVWFYSDSTLQNIVTLSNGGMKIYPNPANNHFTLEYFNPQPGNVSFKIYDLSGRVLREIELVGLHEHIKAEIDLSEIESGVYLLSMRSGSAVETRKFVVQH